MDCIITRDHVYSCFSSSFDKRPCLLHHVVVLQTQRHALLYCGGVVGLRLLYCSKKNSNRGSNILSSTSHVSATTQEFPPAQGLYRVLTLHPTSVTRSYSSFFLFYFYTTLVPPAHNMQLKLNWAFWEHSEVRKMGVNQSTGQDRLLAVVLAPVRKDVAANQQELQLCKVFVEVTLEGFYTAAFHCHIQYCTYCSYTHTIHFFLNGFMGRSPMWPPQDPPSPPDF